MEGRDVSTGATGATAVAPKFSDTLTLFQPGGQILPTIGAVEPEFFPWLRPCLLFFWHDKKYDTNTLIKGIWISLRDVTTRKI